MAVRDVKVMPGAAAYVVDGIMQFDGEIVNMLARAFVRNQLEATIELGMDEPFDSVDGDVNVAELNKYYSDDVPDIAIDYIRDHMKDFTAAIEEVIQRAQINVAVRALKYGTDGKLEDIDVDFSFA